MDRVPKQRDRLAAVEHELGRLQARYELAMSTFKFDEANGLQRRIAVLEGERRVLAAAMPASAIIRESPIGVVPVLHSRPRPGLPRRRGKTRC